MKIVTLGGLFLPGVLGIRVIPQFGQVPGLSKITVSHGSPHGGQMYPLEPSESAVEFAPVVGTGTSWLSACAGSVAAIPNFSKSLRFIWHSGWGIGDVGLSLFYCVNTLHGVLVRITTYTLVDEESQEQMSRARDLFIILPVPLTCGDGGGCFEVLAH